MFDTLNIPLVNEKSNNAIGLLKLDIIDFMEVVDFRTLLVEKKNTSKNIDQDRKSSCHLSTISENCIFTDGGNNEKLVENEACESNSYENSNLDYDQQSDIYPYHSVSQINVLKASKIVCKKLSKSKSKLQSEIWGIEKEISVVNRELAQEANDKLKARAFSNKGISFPKPRRFDLKNGCQAWNVINLRILNWVNENKVSVNIQTTSETQIWDSKQEKYVMSEPIIQNHDKIRYQNIQWIVENV